MDSYRFTYLALKDFIENNIALSGKHAAGFHSLTEEEKINFAIGFQSDFNGWLDHSRPRYGEDGCFGTLRDSTFLSLETLGLAHPGLLEDHWTLLEKEGVDLAPVRRASEKFLRLWQHFIDNRGQF